MVEALLNFGFAPRHWHPAFWDRHHHWHHGFWF